MSFSLFVRFLLLFFFFVVFSGLFVCFFFCFFFLFFFFVFLLTVLKRWSGVSLTLYCFVVYSTGRFVLCLTLCHFFLVFFNPFSIAITSLGEERANLSAFRMVVRFVLVWICRFPLPLDVWEGLWFVVMALPGLFSYLFLLRGSKFANF